MSAKAIKSEDLKGALEQARAEGRKVVFTNGCFDIIHPGHVRYLARARELGDILVVGLNSDASVSRLKPGRPVNGQAERAEVLSALRSVDHVCIFHEDTPYELIRLLKPDVLVKGGDWRPEEIVGADIVSDTRSLSFIEGYSTSEVIDRIREGSVAGNDDWQEVLVTCDPMEGEIVRDLLESGGIRTRLVSHKVTPYPVNVGLMGESRLSVPKEDAGRARELIENPSANGQPRAGL